MENAMRSPLCSSSRFNDARLGRTGTAARLPADGTRARAHRRELGHRQLSWCRLPDAQWPDGRASAVGSPGTRRQGGARSSVARLQRLSAVAQVPRSGARPPPAGASRRRVRAACRGAGRHGRVLGHPRLRARCLDPARPRQRRQCRAPTPHCCRGHARPARPARPGEERRRRPDSGRYRALAWPRRACLRGAAELGRHLSPRRLRPRHRLAGGEAVAPAPGARCNRPAGQSRADARVRQLVRPARGSWTSPPTSVLAALRIVAGRPTDVCRTRAAAAGSCRARRGEGTITGAAGAHDRCERGRAGCCPLATGRSSSMAICGYSFPCFPNDRRRPQPMRAATGGPAVAMRQAF